MLSICVTQASCHILSFVFDFSPNVSLLQGKRKENTVVQSSGAAVQGTRGSV